MNFHRIGLFGQAGVGKDTVADWIVTNHKYVKVAYADAMKQFCYRVFGFTHDQLWGPSSERNRLDTRFPYHWGHTESSFKEELIPFANELVNGTPSLTSLDIVNSIQQWFYWLKEAYPNKLSCRVVLQTLGTECGRSLDPELWVNYVHNWVAPLIADGHLYSQVEGVLSTEYEDDVIPGMVISDHRFGNEVRRTQQLGGHVFLLLRPGKELAAGPGIKGHASEAGITEVRESDFDVVLHLPEGIPAAYELLNAVFINKSWLNPARPNLIP